MTGSQIDEFIERMYSRSGLDRLPAHLESRYGIQVARLTELDLGVFRVGRRDGPSWVARVFPAARPVDGVEGDAEILRFLSQQDFRSERCARPQPVSVHEAQGVLVTEYAEGTKARGDERTFHRLGDLLGALHTLPAAPAAMAREGGAWHHLSFDGGPRAEVTAAMSLLAATEHRVRSEEQALYQELRGELERAEDCHDLPHTLIHPDFVPANVITSRGGDLTLVDWAGAGRGPRISSLGFLLWAAGGHDLARVDAVVAGYRSHVRLEPAELARLAGAIRLRPLIFDCWRFGTGRKELPGVLRELPATRDLAEAIAARAGQAFGNQDGQPRAQPPRSAARPAGAGQPRAQPPRSAARPAGAGQTGAQPPRSAARPAGAGQTGAQAPGSAAPLGGVGATGLAIAAIRAAETAREDRLFADPLAEAFVAASGWTSQRPPGDRRAAALRFWVLARTVFLDELLAAASGDGCLQVVLLGAGFDARAFRLPWPPGVRCFELDTADVLDNKEQVLIAQAVQAGCERIPVACDLLEDWPAALLAAGFAPGQPTAWIAEGLLVYLTQEDVDGIVADLTTLSATGSRLGLTMINRDPFAGDGPGRASLMMTLRRSGAPDDPAGWLAGHGWTAQVTDAIEVLSAHGRPVPAARADPEPGSPRQRRPRGILVAAALDASRR